MDRGCAKVLWSNIKRIWGCAKVLWSTIKRIWGYAEVLWSNIKRIGDVLRFCGVTLKG